MKNQKSKIKKGDAKQKSKTEDGFSVRPGDTVSVYQKDQPPFTGIVIAFHGKNSPSATFVVRAILEGVGVEKIYPLHSPLISSLKVLKKGKVRRAKLYYLREKKGKELKIKTVKEDEKNKPKEKQKTDSTEDKRGRKTKGKRL